VADLQEAISEGATSFLLTEFKYMGVFMVRPSPSQHVLLLQTAPARPRSLGALESLAGPLPLPAPILAGLAAGCLLRCSDRGSGVENQSLGAAGGLLHLHLRAAVQRGRL